MYRTFLYSNRYIGHGGKIHVQTEAHIFQLPDCLGGVNCWKPHRTGPYVVTVLFGLATKHIEAVAIKSSINQIYFTAPLRLTGGTGARSIPLAERMLTGCMLSNAQRMKDEDMPPLQDGERTLDIMSLKTRDKVIYEAMLNDDIIDGQKCLVILYICVYSLFILNLKVFTFNVLMCLFCNLIYSGGQICQQR